MRAVLIAGVLDQVDDAVCRDMLGFQNPPTCTEMDRFTFQSGLTVGFCGPKLSVSGFRFRDYGFWFLLAVFCTGMLNSHQSHKCGNPRNHATVTRSSLFHHLPHRKKYKQLSETIVEQHQTNCSSISKAATASTQQRPKQRRWHQRRQLQNEQQHMQRNGSSGENSSYCIKGIDCSKDIGCSAKSGNTRDSQLQLRQ